MGFTEMELTDKLYVLGTFYSTLSDIVCIATNDVSRSTVGSIRLVTLPCFV